MEEQQGIVEDFTREVRSKLGGWIKPSTWIDMRGHKFQVQDTAVKLSAQFGFERAVEIFVSRLESGGWFPCPGPKEEATRKEKVKDYLQRRRERKMAELHATEAAYSFLHNKGIIDATGMADADKVVQAADGSIDVLATAEACGFVRQAETVDEEREARWAAGEFAARGIRDSL